MATLTYLSSRTIQRHLKTLIKSGIIIEKILLSRKKGYLIWMHPIIVLKRCGQPIYTDIFSFKGCYTSEVDIQGFKNFIRTSCLQSYSSNDSYNNIIRAVDTVDNTSNVLTGNTQKEELKKIIETQKEVFQRVGTPVNSGPARCASIEHYADALWELAERVLYKDVELVPNQIRLGKQHLLEWHAPVAPKNLAKVHQNYCARIWLVREYINRDRAKRFVQFPGVYFDPTNPKGFTATKSWRKNQVTAKIAQQKKRVLNQQIKRYRDNGVRDSEESTLSLFRTCEKVIQNLKDKRLLDEFHKEVSNV